MSDNSLITLSRSAVKNNISFLREQFGPKIRISSVVKANAYGHGIEQMVPLFEHEGVDHFAVFDFSEANRVFNSLSNSSSSIMIMGYISDKDLEVCIKKGFEFFVFNLDRLIKAREVASRIGIPAKIHIELETGMNRSGLFGDALKSAINIIKKNNDCFSLIGLCTHLAGAESVSNYFRIKNQLKRFNKLEAYLKKRKIVPQFSHCANSAAAFVYPESRKDLIRVGIMQYGFWSSAETFIYYITNKQDKNDPLKRVLGWKSQVMVLKKVEIGEFVGYGISYLAQKETRTALIPVGYAMGYSRSLSNRGRVLINGQRCSVIGLVNMNMIIADVTELENVNEGDEVVIIGTQGDLEIKVSAFSDLTDELNYEILAHLSETIERKIND